MLALEEIKGRKDLPQGDEDWHAEFITVIEEEDEDADGS
jgi:hypothetical protein